MLISERAQEASMYVYDKECRCPFHGMEVNAEGKLVPHKQNMGCPIPYVAKGFVSGGAFSPCMVDKAEQVPDPKSEFCILKHIPK